MENTAIPQQPPADTDSTVGNTEEIVAAAKRMRKEHATTLEILADS